MIHHIKQALDGLRALPEMAEILPGVVDALNRWRCHEAAEMTERFMRALSNLGVAQDAIERFVAGDDIESDWLVKRDYYHLGVINERDDLRRQLDESKAAHEYWHDAHVELRGKLELTEQQLATERESHAETKSKLSGAEQAVADAIQTLGEQESKLASALDKLDKLTRWRKQSEEPCPFSDSTKIVTTTKFHGELNHIRAEHAGLYEVWRHTPESLAAWKAQQKAVGDDSQV